MVEARPQSVKTINQTQLLQITMAIAAISCSWFSVASGGDASIAHHDHHHHHGKRIHNHWRMIT